MERARKKYKIVLCVCKSLKTILLDQLQNRDTKSMSAESDD